MHSSHRFPPVNFSACTEHIQALLCPLARWAALLPKAPAVQRPPCRAVLTDSLWYPVENGVNAGQCSLHNMNLLLLLWCLMTNLGSAAWFAFVQDVELRCSMAT